MKVGVGLVLVRILSQHEKILILRSGALVVSKHAGDSSRFLWPPGSDMATQSHIYVV